MIRKLHRSKPGRHQQQDGGCYGFVGIRWPQQSRRFCELLPRRWERYRRQRKIRAAGIDVVGTPSGSRTVAGVSTTPAASARKLFATRISSSNNCRNAATGMAILAMLGAGNTPFEGDFQESVLDGIKFLLSHSSAMPGASICEDNMRPQYWHVRTRSPRRIVRDVVNAAARSQGECRQ